MKKINAILIMLTAIMAILCVSVWANRAVNSARDKRWEKERVERTIEVTAVTDDLKMTISEISKMSTEEIQEYINENAYVEEQPIEVSRMSSALPASGEASEENIGESLGEPSLEGSGDNSAKNDSENVSETDSGTASGTSFGLGSENLADPWESRSSSENVERVSELGYEAVSGYFASSAEVIGEEQTGGKKTKEEDVEKKNETEEDEAQGAEAKKDDVEEIVDDTNDTENTEDDVDEDAGIEEPHHYTLAERQSLRTSYEETLLWIEADRETIENSDAYFSGLKIACLGDSITEAANLLDVPEYTQYTYPTRLAEILDAEVVNLGIGGSSLGRYWDKAFCDRYTDIPEDTDIILIMGGDNDGYCLHEDMVGSFDNREYRTLYGDVNDLFAGLKEDYPNAEVVVMTPMPNLLHDVLRKERPELLSQTVVINCLLELAEEYDYKVIDNYNSNFLDSHDAGIVSEYIPDSVHPNEAGYDIFAKHVAAELIRMYEGEEEVSDGAKEDTGDAEEDVMDESIKDGDETVEDTDGTIEDRDGTVEDTDGIIGDRDEAIKDRDEAIEERDTVAEDGTEDEKDETEGDESSGGTKDNVDLSFPEDWDDSKREPAETVVFGRE